jgi:hypothetical protein
MLEIVLLALTTGVPAVAVTLLGGAEIVTVGAVL